LCLLSCALRVGTFAHDYGEAEQPTRHITSASRQTRLSPANNQRAHGINQHFRLSTVVTSGSRCAPNYRTYTQRRDSLRNFHREHQHDGSSPRILIASFSARYVLPAKPYPNTTSTVIMASRRASRSLQSRSASRAVSNSARSELSSTGLFISDGEEEAVVGTLEEDEELGKRVLSHVLVPPKPRPWLDTFEALPGNETVRKVLRQTTENGEVAYEVRFEDFHTSLVSHRLL